MGKQVSANFTYTDWLKRRSETEQKEILGLGKWQFWKHGKIGLTVLVDQSGRAMTLKELHASVE